MSDEIKVGDLVARKGLKSITLGVVFAVQSCEWSAYHSQCAIHFIDQRTGREDWSWEFQLIKLNKPTEEIP